MERAVPSFDSFNMCPEPVYRAALRASFGQDPRQVTGQDATGEHQLSDLDFTNGTPTTPTATKRPPRPQNAWILYRTAKLKQFQAQNRARGNREMHSAGSSSVDLKERRRLCIQAEASRLIATMWKEEDAVVKASYFALANDNKAMHSIAFPDYKFKPNRKARSDKRDSATSTGPASDPSRSGRGVNTERKLAGAQVASPTTSGKIIGRAEHAQQQRSSTFLRIKHRTPSNHLQNEKGMSSGAWKEDIEERSCSTSQPDKNTLHKTLPDCFRMFVEPVLPKSEVHPESGPDTSFISQPGLLSDPFNFNLNTDGKNPDYAAALLGIRSSTSFSTQPSITPRSSEQQFDYIGQDGRMQASHGEFDWFSSTLLNPNLPLVNWDTTVGSSLSSHFPHQGREVCAVQQPRGEMYASHEGGSHIVAAPVNAFPSNALQLQFPSQHIQLHPQSTGHTAYGVWAQPKGRCDDEYQLSSWNGL